MVAFDSNDHGNPPDIGMLQGVRLVLCTMSPILNCAIVFYCIIMFSIL